MFKLPFGSVVFKVHCATRRVQQSRIAPWVTAASCAAISLTGLALAVTLLYRNLREESSLKTQIGEIQGQMKMRERAFEHELARSSFSAPFADFVQRLPPAPDVRPLLAELERSSSAAGGTLGGIQFQEHAAAIDQLARTEVTVLLRGTYPAHKQVILDTMARFHGATLAQWKSRRTSQSGEVDATVVLSVWGAAANTASANLASRSASERAR